MNEQGLAGKIQGWLPGDYDLDLIVGKMRFIGLSLTCPENTEGMEAEDLVGPGQTILDLSGELKRFNGDYTRFYMKLLELAKGLKPGSLMKPIG